MPDSLTRDCQAPPGRHRLAASSLSRGPVLGRRTKGLTRTLIHLDCPESDQPARLRLWVEKPFDLKPPPLGVTIGTAGNEYDHSPPAHDNHEDDFARTRGKTPVKLDACGDWLTNQLSSGATRVKTIRDDATLAGYNSGTLYRCMRKLAIVEDTIYSRKWWRLPDPSTFPLVTMVTTWD
jgi:hypothetical protein